MWGQNEREREMTGGRERKKRKGRRGNAECEMVESWLASLKISFSRGSVCMLGFRSVGVNVSNAEQKRFGMKCEM